MLLLLLFLYIGQYFAQKLILQMQFLVLLIQLIEMLIAHPNPLHAPKHTLTGLMSCFKNFQSQSWSRARSAACFKWLGFCFWHGIFGKWASDLSKCGTVGERRLQSAQIERKIWALFLSSVLAGLCFSFWQHTLQRWSHQAALSEETQTFRGRWAARRRLNWRRHWFYKTHLITQD